MHRPTRPTLAHAAQRSSDIKDPRAQAYLKNLEAQVHSGAQIVSFLVRVVVQHAHETRVAREPSK